ncbi:MAG: transcription antitermination factor NusB [Clostridia bacterium]|nr:transcription antitermination factor NusB [Clostridia bacterium]
MATATRRELREAVFTLLFETDFHADEQPADIYALAKENRDLYEDEYIDNTYFGVIEKREALDVMIGRFSKDWKITRLSHVSRAVLRLGVYELMYSDLPVQIALNEAIVLAKKFDDPKARPFVNGVLNAIKNEIEQKGKESCAAVCEQAAKEAQAITAAPSEDAATTEDAATQA